MDGKRISNLRYTDATMLLTESEAEMVELLDRIGKASKVGLKVNKSKTMIVDQPNKNQPEKTEIHGIGVVYEFVYLGSLISNTGGCEREIRKRAAISKTVVEKLNKI